MIARFVLQPLFYTSENSWLEKDFDPLKEPEFNEGTDRKGFLSLGVLVAGVAASRDEGEILEEEGMTRLVVIGEVGLDQAAIARALAEVC